MPTETSTRRLIRTLLAVGIATVAALSLATSAHADPAPLCDTDASCAALGGAPGYGVTAEKVATYGPVFVAEATVTPAEWDCLRGLGYVGAPLDGVEALYADASDVAECSPRPA